MTGPSLSVVLATDSRETIRIWLSHLEAQSARELIELVLVAPPDADLHPLPDGFAGVNVVADEVRSVPSARLVGVRHARAPVIALAETHSFPAPGWAEALLEAHRGPWAVVGPAVTNANPASVLSRAGFLLDYGPWAAPRKAGEVEDLPGHNSSYKREALLDPASGPLFNAEAGLHARLRARGARLYLDPAASLAHLNVTRPASWALERVLAARLFAATRALAWARPRRLGYALAWPLIPLVRLPRLRRDAARTGQGASPRFLLAVLGALFLSALGEAAGYAFGAGAAAERLVGIELHRERHLAA